MSVSHIVIKMFTTKTTARHTQVDMDIFQLSVRLGRAID